MNAIGTSYNDNGNLVITLENGASITAVNDADYTNRVFPGWWGDAKAGEEYTCECGARGEDQDGNCYAITWSFALVRDEEPLMEDYPWEDVSRIRVAQQG